MRTVCMTEYVESTESAAHTMRTRYAQQASPTAQFPSGTSRLELRLNPNYYFVVVICQATRFIFVIADFSFLKKYIDIHGPPTVYSLLEGAFRWKWNDARMRNGTPCPCQCSEAPKRHSSRNSRFDTLSKNSRRNKHLKCN